MPIALNRLLDGLDIEVKPFAVCEIREGASLPLSHDDAAGVHYVLEGCAVARLPRGLELALRPHSVMITPPGVSVEVACPAAGDSTTKAAPRCKPLPGGWEWAQVGEGAPGVVLTCGLLVARHRGTTSLFDYLRVPLVEQVGQETSFRDAFRLLMTELAWPKPGTPVLAETLMKQCLIILLRRYAKDGLCRAPWLAALETPRLGRALSAMVDRPETPFTLQSLAGVAGMSRAAFADHFKRTFDRPPMDFLKEVRLRRAAHLLTLSDLPVKAVAAEVGFASRSYFSRAFTLLFGVGPTEYRRAARTALPA